MFGLTFLKRLPPAMTAWLFYYVLPVLLFVRFLIGTLFGIFLLSMLLYWAVWAIGEPKPYSFSQLILWVDALPSESKTAVTTSVLTVIGFLIAFHTATANWKSEALAQLKAHVAGDIELFFSEASRRTIDAEIYVRTLVDAVKFLQLSGPTNDASFKVERALSMTQAFHANRDRLSAMSVEVHRIAGRHYPVLATVWGASSALEECAAAFSEITQGMWIHTPTIHSNLPDPIGQFVAQVNVTQCSAFLAICEGNFAFINGTTGGVRGMLLAPLVGVNFATRFSLAGKRSIFVDAMEKVRGARRRKS